MYVEKLNVKLNQKLKYKEICKLLNIEEKKRGNSRNSQMKEWKRYFNFYKPNPKGQTFIIDEIYDTPKPKIDNRKNNLGANNNMYAQYADKLLLNYFKQQSKNEINITINRLAKEIGLIHEINFKIAYDNLDIFYKSLKKKHISMNKTAILDCFTKTKSTINSVIKSSLKRLKNNNYIDFEYGYFLIDNRENIIFEDVIFGDIKEQQKIKDIEDDILEEMNISKRSILQYDDKLRKKYYNRCYELVINNLNCNGYFKGYKIFIKKKVKKCDSIKNEKKLLNNVMISRTIDKLEKLQIKTKKDNPYWGEINPNEKKYIVDRLDENYMKNVKILIDVLINYNSQKVKCDE